MDYIYEHLQEKMTIEGAAAIYRSTPHIFPSYFPKRWACPFGSSSSTPESMPQKNMLAYSDFSYLEISLSLGFSSQSAFTSTFRRLTGMTPGKYREAFGNSTAEQI